jgi:hypothetical protein
METAEMVAKEDIQADHEFLLSEKLVLLDILNDLN